MDAPDLIRKLHALASHPATPPHEAAVARAKLRRLLARHGLTEADIDTEITVAWSLSVFRYDFPLLCSVCSFVLDTYRLPVAPETIRGSRVMRARLNTTVTDKIDILACFGYYRDLHETDRRTAMDEAKELRAEARKLVREAALRIKAMAKMPGIMVYKYNLFPPSVLTAERESTPMTKEELEKFLAEQAAKEKKKSKAQLAREERDRQAHHHARRMASDADAWKKGAGVEDGVFKLEG